MLQAMDTSVAFPRLARRVAVTTVALAVLATPFASAADAAITKGFRAKVDADLAPGINFRFGKVTTTGGRQVEVRVGTVDPRNEKVKLKALLSNNKVVKRDVVTKIALKRERPGFKAMVATNGDMSTRQRVDAYAAPHSMAVSNGELLLATELTQEQRRFAEGIRRCGRSLLSVINDVLDFSKIEAGKLELERTDFDLRDKLESYLSTGRIGALMYSNPNNPAWICFTEKELAIIGDLYPPAERARVQALFGSLFVLAFLIGPTLGGVFTDTIGWRWVFYINIPIGITAAAVATGVLKKIPARRLNESMDHAGAVLFADESEMLACLALAVRQGVAGRCWWCRAAESRCWGARD